MGKIGLFMGSFNPIHIGHMIIANYMLEFTDLDEILFIVSPQNPFKENSELSPEQHRLEMVKIAISNSKNMSVSDIEFKMKKPSYTIDTLKKLIGDSLDEYFLIIGSDNLIIFENWHKYKEILKLVDLYVYNRKGYNYINIDFINKYNIKIFNNCPEIEMSSTFIRKNTITKNLKYFLPGNVYEYMNKHNLYKK